MKVGDQLALVNGRGAYFESTIEEAHPKKCTVKINSFKQEQRPNYEVHIAIAPTKLNDRMEFFLEKATELGITKITLLKTKNSERKAINLERFEKIVIAAMKQSKRLYLPEMNDLTDIKEFLNSCQNGLIAHCYDGEKNTIASKLQQINCPILIGPEGDFTLEEVEMAKKQGYHIISLGENRLRTETAGLYACMEAILCLRKG
jgi:16S rRNA (uracil1498-N3)-methyltransferase